MVGGTTEELLELVLVEVISEELLERLEVTVVLLVLLDHVRGDALARSVGEQTLEHVCGVDAAERLEQSGAVVWASLLQGIKVFLGAEGDLGLLAGEVAEDIPELSRKADHGAREGLRRLLGIELVWGWNRHERLNLLGKRGTVELLLVDQQLCKL